MKYNYYCESCQGSFSWCSRLLVCPLCGGELKELEKEEEKENA